MNVIRITGGSLKGHKLHIPDSPELRPTSSKVREAMFDSLREFVEDAEVLDLFAGAGTIGFEALSRGAKYVTFVDFKNAAAIRKNAKLLDLPTGWEIKSVPIERILDQLNWARYSLVFADPPYDKGFVEKVVTIAGEKMQQGMLWLEHSKRERIHPSWLGSLEIVREKNYGDTWLTTLQHGGHDPNA